MGEISSWRNEILPPLEIKIGNLIYYTLISY